MKSHALALATAAKSAFTDALGLAVLIGAGFSFVGVLIVARFMPARHTNVREDDDSSLRELELEGPLAGRATDITTPDCLPLRQSHHVF